MTDCRFAEIIHPPVPADTSSFAPAAVRGVLAFHRSFPGYEPTPLAELSALADSLCLGGLFVKDESRRFGLNAFKALGGSYAIGQYIAQRLSLDADAITYEKITSPEVRERLGAVTFITATDGNHGRGVAWTANRLGQKSVVYMPRGTAPERLQNILALGSDARITDLAYDDAVRLAAADAAANGWVLVQDTTQPGYEEIPLRIMQGYTTMISEITNQLGDTVPTHVFLQAGVGSMAAAVAAFLAERFGEQRPKVILVEPLSADCFFRTAAANDGQLHAAEGEMHSMMAGLCCAEPCAPAWNILRSHADFCAAIPDEFAADGMRRLGRPLGDDAAIVSGESGACTLGLVLALMRRPELAAWRDAIGLGREARVLCISTEGDTDRVNYRRILAE